MRHTYYLYLYLYLFLFQFQFQFLFQYPIRPQPRIGVCRPNIELLDWVPPLRDWTCHTVASVPKGKSMSPCLRPGTSLYLPYLCSQVRSGAGASRLASKGLKLRSLGNVVRSTKWRRRCDWTLDVGIRGKYQEKNVYEVYERSSLFPFLFLSAMPCVRLPSLIVVNHCLHRHLSYREYKSRNIPNYPTYWRDTRHCCTNLVSCSANWRLFGLRIALRLCQAAKLAGRTCVCFETLPLDTFLLIQYSHHLFGIGVLPLSPTHGLYNNQ